MLDAETKALARLIAVLDAGMFCWDVLL